MKYILIAFIFLACDNHPGEIDSRKISTELLDTIKSSPGKIIATPILFETAFINGSTQLVNKNVFSFYGITIGKIKINSGYVIACDPMHIDEYGIPFTQVFPAGEFAMQLAITKFKNQESIAFARIKFSDEPVQKWEFALLKGQKPMPIGGEDMPGYSVDAGVGLFIDKEASKVFDRKTAENTDREVFKEMEKHYHNNWKYTMYNFGNHNLAAFSTGLGDGYFGTYIGFDANGNPCRLLTDFGLFDWKQNKN
ncbi:DUF4241 domain-containing protein [Flavitalea sp.]|nr:DUF4241 domain-containing protein [Flavitalea sp.]